MKKSFSIPAFSFAILAVVVAVGFMTKAEPLPLVFLPQNNAVITHDAEHTVILKKQAAIARATAEHVQTTDVTLYDALLNTQAYSREQYQKTLARKTELEEKENASVAEVEETTPSQKSVLPTKSIKQTITAVKKEVGSGKQQKNTELHAQAPEVQKPDATISVTLISIGGGSYTVSVPAGSTVESVMNVATSQGFSYSAKPYPGLGSYVTAVNGVSEDSRNGLYWIYYINNAKAQAGISSTTISAGDIIVWRLEQN